MDELSTEDLARLIALATRDEPGYLSQARIFRRELAASGYTIVATDRLARLIALAEATEELAGNMDPGDAVLIALDALRSGDLVRPGEGGGG